MKNIISYITERLRLSNHNVFENYDDVYGEGEIITFNKYKFPWEDNYNKQTITDFKKILYKYIKETDTVYIITTQGDNINQCVELSEKFKEKLKSIKLGFTILGCPQHITGRCSTIVNYPKEDKQTMYLRLIDWKDSDKPIIYFIIKT